jgi:hypothetical protein
MLERNEKKKQEKAKKEVEFKLFWLTMFAGATGSLSIFSFLKDLFPFLIAKFPTWFIQYEVFYKSFAVIFPVLLMLLILLLFRKNKNN